MTKKEIEARIIGLIAEYCTKHALDIEGIDDARSSAYWSGYMQAVEDAAPQWSTETPTEPGWYWCRINGEYLFVEQVIAKTCNDYQNTFSSRTGTEWNQRDVQWLKIEEPEVPS